MVAVVVLFPVMLAQFAVNVFGLRSADSSSLFALEPLQLIVLSVSALLLALGLLLVVAISTPFVNHALGDQADAPPDADDALRVLRRNITDAYAGGLPGGVPWRSAAPLILGTVLVFLVSWWQTGNEQTIGTAFLTMCGLMFVSVATMPVLAVAILLARAGFTPPEPEPEPKAEPVAAPLAAPDPNLATSKPPPGAAAPQQPVDADAPVASVSPPGSAAVEQPAPADTSADDTSADGGRGSVPPPG